MQSAEDRSDASLSRPASRLNIYIYFFFHNFCLNTPTFPQLLLTVTMLSLSSLKHQLRLRQRWESNAFRRARARRNGGEIKARRKREHASLHPRFCRVPRDLPGINALPMALSSSCYGVTPLRRSATRARRKKKRRNKVADDAAAAAAIARAIRVFARSV